MSRTVTAQDLNLTLHNNDEASLFKWLIASFLMGKRIRAEIAAQAYRVIVDKHQLDTPRKLARCRHADLVAMLGEAGYARYDESTADRLVALAQRLNDEYAGKVVNLHHASADLSDFEQRLQAFKGIGPKTVEIFMREAGRALYGAAHPSSSGFLEQ